MQCWFYDPETVTFFFFKQSMEDPNPLRSMHWIYFWTSFCIGLCLGLGFSLDLFIYFLENLTVLAFLVMGLRWTLQLLGYDAITATC